MPKKIVSGAFVNLRILLKFSAVACQLCAQPVPAIHASHQSALSIDIAGKPSPKWSGGRLLILDNSDPARPAVLAYDRQGQLHSRVDFTMPNATFIQVMSFAGGADGTVALSGTGSDAMGRAGAFVAWVREGKTTLVRTSPYIPWVVTVAADGAIWTAGGHHKFNPSDSSFHVFRRFSPGGEQTGSYVAQNEFRGPLSTDAVFGSHSGGLVWYSGQGRQLIEIDAAGTVKKTSEVALPKDHRLAGFALTDSGDLYVTAKQSRNWRLSRLDRSQNVWQTIDRGVAPGKPTLHLYGADHESLVGWRDYKYISFFNVRN